MKKIILIYIILLTNFSYASERCIFDASGVCEKKIHNQQDINQVMQKLHKKYYIALDEQKTKHSLYIKPVAQKHKGKKRWFEVDWNQGVKLCPEKNFNTGNGTWVVNASAHIDSINCLYVDGTPYTRSILVLFARNLNDLADADSSWILVNQTIVELAHKDFQIWDGHNKDYYGKINEKSKLKKIRLTQDLIVDKTELRVRDAIWLRDGKVKYPLLDQIEFYPTNDSLKILDYPISPDIHTYLFQKWRSEKDGLNSTLKETPIDEIDTSAIRFKTQTDYHFVDIFDTTSNGYRLPTQDELKVLQLGGKNTLFLWGNDTSENKLRMYMNTKCSSTDLGVYPVKQYAANSFGLYDVYGNAEELSMHYWSNNRVDAYYDCNSYNEINFDIGKSCELRKKYKCRKRKHPNTNDGPGFIGMRLVRKLE
ncbi:SUMF1/EgtB/PvdO family nonheme iron enzyme [Candidatus Saccharibacteria bacterium]|jgi:hypothetical protein|nr:SUMF1/EgtB/PvdO family nonheme iron enzyme [Candidatus Saccharibacteria bacterium]